MEKQELEQDIDLMPHHQEVNLPASLHLEEEQVSSDQGDTEILGGVGLFGPDIGLEELCSQKNTAATGPFDNIPWSAD